MQQDFDPKILKALFSQLRRAVGSQEAAASYLGVSRQRVGQLESASEDHADDVPTWAQVWTLENVLGRSIVFVELARRIDPPAPPRDANLTRKVHDVIRRAADLLPLADDASNGNGKAVQAVLDAIDAIKQSAAECAAIAFQQKERA